MQRPLLFEPLGVRNGHKFAIGEFCLEPFIPMEREAVSTVGRRFIYTKKDVWSITSLVLSQLACQRERHYQGTNFNFFPQSY
jgi:hypothetical protein